MRQVEQELRNYYNPPDNGGIHSSKEKTAMQKTVLLAELELNKKQKTKKKGFKTFLFEQMRMTGMRIWIGQTGMILLVSLLVYFMTGVDFRFLQQDSLLFWQVFWEFFCFQQRFHFYTEQRNTEC